MRRPKPHPDNLYFPIPPARIDRTLDEAPLLPAVAATYLAEIQRWREAVVEAIADNDPAIARVENFTSRARERLVVLLESRWDVSTRLWAVATGYDLTPFPVTRRSMGLDDPMATVMEVLLWRTTVVNYLTDVWDALPRPELSAGECAAIGEFLRPARMEGRCIYCLTEFDFSRLDPEEHGCVMTSLAHAG
ncbi:MAG: hypothetical protein ACRENJ_00315 [Candidatus Eiseniibacteriota bacterium]